MKFKLILYIICVLLSYNTSAKEFVAIDFLKQYGIYAKGFDIHNDTIIYQHSGHDKYYLYYNNKLDSIDFSFKSRVDGNLIMNTNLIYNANYDFIHKYQDGEWSRIDEEYGKLEDDQYHLTAINYNPNIEKFFLTISFSGLFFIDNDKIVKIETDQNNPSRYLSIGAIYNSLYLEKNFYYFNINHELIRINNDGFKFYNRDDYYLENNKMLGSGKNIIPHAIKVPYDNKLWFSTAEGKIVSFNGNKFTKHSFLQNGPLQNEQFRIPTFNFDNNGDLFIYSELVKDTIINSEQTYITYDYRLYKFFKKSNFNAWQQINYPKEYGLIINSIIVDKNVNNKKIYLNMGNELLIYDNITSVNEVEKAPTLFFREFYPNPAREYLNIKFAAVPRTVDQMEVNIYNIVGIEVMNEKPEITYYNSYDGFGECRINISSLHPGIYLVILNDGETVRYSKFVKTK